MSTENDIFSRDLDIGNNQLKEQIVGRGFMFYRQGESADNLVILKSGVAVVFNDSEDGKKNVRDVVSGPTILGEDAFMRDRNIYDSCSQAFTSCRINYVSRQSLLQSVQNNPTVALTVLEFMARRLDSQGRRSEDLMELDMLTRIRNNLKTFTEMMGTLELPISHDELAEINGVTRVTITRAMRKLESEGFVVPQYKRHRNIQIRY